MAHIQPSFLHFYLFRTRQHNTSFLLTSKDELEYPGGSFLNNPNFYPFGQQHFPKNNSKPSPQIFRHINVIIKIPTHRLNFLISYPVSNILFNRISKITFSKTKVKPHSRGNSQSSLATNQSVLQNTRFSNPFLIGIHKISRMTRFSNFPDPSQGGRPSQNLVWLLAVLKISIPF